MELTLNIKAEVVEIEIVQVVVERILNLLPNFQESEEQEGCESCARDGDPVHGADDLERQEQEIQPVKRDIQYTGIVEARIRFLPKRHSEMSLVGKWQRCVANPLEI